MIYYGGTGKQDIEGVGEFVKILSIRVADAGPKLVCLRNAGSMRKECRVFKNFSAGLLISI